MAKVATLESTTVLVGDEEYIATSITYEPAETRYVRVATAVLPDPMWRFVDHAGHVHTWRRSGRGWSAKTALPTLHQVTANVACDGSCGLDGGNCGGYTQNLYACRVCAAWVTPKFVPDHAARTTGIPMGPDGPDRMTLELTGRPPLALSAPAPVSVLGRTGTGWFREAFYRANEWATFTVDVVLDLR